MMEKNRKVRIPADQPQKLHRPLRTNRGIREIAEMEKRNQDARSRIDRFSGAITNLAGSAAAIVIHTIWFTLWILINVHAVPGIGAFDPFPFSFLTMVVSLEAIFLTLFVLISQNRMSQESDRRARLDLEINILAERETTMILRMLNEISGHLKTDGGTRSEFEELLEETRIDELARKLDDALPSQ
jgi:uncharacterized membrane protein